MLVVDIKCKKFRAVGTKLIDKLDYPAFLTTKTLSSTMAPRCPNP